MAQATAVPDLQEQPEERAWYEVPGDEVAASLGVDPGQGLDAAEAALVPGPAAST